MEEEKKLPRPSVEVLRKYDELYDRLCDHNLSDEENEEVVDSINDIISSYDLANYVFDDSATGKKGVKNPAGEVIVPACYDEFCFIGDHNAFQLTHMSAEKEGKWGIVTVDGTNKVLCDFIFDHLQWYPYAGLYLSCWDGIKDKFGFVTKEGKKVTPNVFDKFYEPCNGFMLLEGDGKFGAIDTSSYNYLLPEYDDVDCEPDEIVVFHKDGKEGYVVVETGEFITKDQYENDDRYIDAWVYNCYLDI